MLDEKLLFNQLLSHWELEKTWMRSSTVLFCNRLTWCRESDKITALPTVTKESSNGDFSEVAGYDSRLRQPALFGLQEVRGKLLPQDKLQSIYDSAEDRIQHTLGDTRHSTPEH